MALRAESSEDSPRLVTAGNAGRQLAARLTGRLGNLRQLPLVCLPGLVRNSEDFEALIPRFADIAGSDWPVLRIDLVGRGDSTPENRRQAYSTARDAEDALSVVRSFGISRAVWLGQNHGGQVIQMIAVHAPEAIGGAILCDSGPVIDVRGFFGLPERGIDDLHRILLLRREDFEVGLLADTVEGVVRIDGAGLRAPLATFGQIDAAYIKGITDDRLVVLDAQAILADPRILLDEDVS